MALTTLVNVQHRLQIQFGDPVDPTVLNLIARADAVIEHFVGYPIEQHTVTEQFQGDGFLDKYTPKLPVVSITSVTEDGVLLTLDTHYQVSLMTGALTRLHGIGFNRSRLWNVGMNNIVVVYEGGFAAVPAAIEAVATDMVAREFYDGAQNAQAGVETGGVPGITSREVIGEYEVSYRDGVLRAGTPSLTDDDKSILRGFQRRVFA